MGPFDITFIPNVVQIDSEFIKKEHFHMAAQNAFFFSKIKLVKLEKYVKFEVLAVWL
jgi:hypothetical protein